MYSKESLRSDIVGMAYEIIDMDTEIRSLREENERLLKIEKEYDKLLTSSFQHSQAMAGNMLKCLLTPGVTESLAKNGTFTS